MGVIQHDTVIATASYDEDITKFKQWEESVSPPSDPIFSPGEIFAVSNVMTNGYRTIVMFPDGSKEGWGTSDYCDQVRESFIKFCKDSDIKYVHISS